MKCFAVLATLAVLSVADAGPRRFRQQRPRFQVEPVNGQADGQSASSITSGISETPFELSQIDMLRSDATDRLLVHITSYLTFMIEVRFAKQCQTS